MELLNFYKVIGFFSEVLILIPIILGLRVWQRLSTGLRFFLLFLGAEFLINVVSIFYAAYLVKNNLFLFFFYSWFWNIFLLIFLHEYTNYKKIILFLMVCGATLIVLEYRYFGVSKEMNYYSGFFVNMVVFVFSLQSFFRLYMKDIRSESPLQNPTLLILLGLTVQFFVRTLDIIFKKQLFQTSFYSVFWYYEIIIYYFIMLLVCGLYMYAFYSLKNED